MENYAIQMENIKYIWKIITIQMKNCAIEMENYTIRIKKIKYCNVWHAIPLCKGAIKLMVC
jgi:hypothetical protein